MSKYHRTTTKFFDRDCLVAALNDVGYKTVEVHDTAANLYGYHGDMRADKANIIVRRNFISSAANDLGFKWNAETKSFDAIVSEYDSGKHDSKWFGHLTAKYAQHKTLKAVKSLGFTLKAAPVRKNGKLVMEVAR